MQRTRTFETSMKRHRQSALASTSRLLDGAAPWSYRDRHLVARRFLTRGPISVGRPMPARAWCGTRGDRWPQGIRDLRGQSVVACHGGCQCDFTRLFLLTPLHAQHELCLMRSPRNAEKRPFHACRLYRHCLVFRRCHRRGCATFSVCPERRYGVTPTLLRPCWRPRWRHHASSPAVTSFFSPCCQPRCPQFRPGNNDRRSLARVVSHFGGSGLFTGFLKQRDSGEPIVLVGNAQELLPQVARSKGFCLLTSHRRTLAPVRRAERELDHLVRPLRLQTDE
jgi:hypothetical protein